MILVGGGARSGKALELALARSERPAFVATAEALDGEMRERIAHHREDRDPRFETVEAPYELAATLSTISASYSAIVVDCLTLWLTNVMLRDEGSVEAQSAELLEAIAGSPSMVIAVTNEVGCGIVPENALARRFRDEAGRLNARCAAMADEVYWMVFGCALRVK